MITLEQAIKLATEAHKGQYRTPTKVSPVDKHTLENWEISKLQQNNGTDFGICKEEGKYTMNHHLELLLSEPYINHPLAVMSMMTTEEEKIVAVLHDVFEDSTAQLCNHAKEYNFNEREYFIKFADITYSLTSNLWASLYALTKPNSDWDKFKEKGNYQSYQGYIKDLTLNRVATKVKIADIVHNLSCSPSDHAKEKYLKAIPVLLKSL